MNLTLKDIDTDGLQNGHQMTLALGVLYPDKGHFCSFLWAISRQGALSQTFVRHVVRIPLIEFNSLVL